jgi:hypothetical protein
MTRKIMRRVSWPIVFAGLAAPFVTNCGGLPKMPGVPGLPGGNCPDMNLEAIDKFDFAANFKLKADVGAKLKAGVGAAVELKALADKLDADLLTACGGLAKDLGDTGTYTNRTPARPPSTSSAPSRPSWAPTPPSSSTSTRRSVAPASTPWPTARLTATRALPARRPM